jgi:hypothetical protein
MRHFINGVEITPRNIESIGFVSNWTDSTSMSDKDHKDLSLNVDTIILPNEGKREVENWLSTMGSFAGIPYQVQMSNGTKIDYYVDLTDQPIYKDYEVEVKIKRLKNQDNFYEKAQGTSFDYLAFTNKATFTYIDVPYIIVPQNQIEMGLTLSISLFVMVQNLETAIFKLQELATELVADLIPDTGVGVGAVIIVKVVDLIKDAVKLALQIAYVALLIIAIKKLADQLSELIFPKVRNFKACKVKELIEKSCISFGYTFKSTLLDSLDGLTVLPVPLIKSKYKGKNLKKYTIDFIANELDFAYTKGHPTGSDSVSSIWQLVQAIETTFNAKCRVSNGLVEIESVNYWKDIATNQINTSLILQDTRQDKYTLNTHESWKRCYIHYQPDYSDYHTLDNFDVTDFEASTESIQATYNDNIKGLRDISVPFSLGRRKETLNWIEQRAKDLFIVIDSICSTSFESNITDRIGVLIVSQQYFVNTKLLYTSNGKQLENYIAKIGASALWYNYHYLSQIQLNGYKIKESVKILMNDENFVNLLNNNWANINGKVCELLNLEYKDMESYATISYKEPFDYSSKFLTTTIING